MKYFLRLLTYAKKYKILIFLNFIFNIFYSIFSSLSIYIIIPILGILFKGDSGISDVVSNKNEALGEVVGNLNTLIGDFIRNSIAQEGIFITLMYVSIAGITMFFLKNISTYLGSYFLVNFLMSVINDIRLSLHNKYVELNIGFHKKHKKGDLISRISNDNSVIESTFLTSFQSITREPIMIIISLWIMFSMSYRLTLFVLVLIPISGTVISLIVKSLRENSKKAQYLSGHVISLVEEHLNGLNVIKAFTAEDKVNQQFKVESTNYKNTLIKMWHRKDMASPVSEFLGSIVIFSVVLFGGNLVLLGESSLSAEEFIGFIGFFYQIITPAKNLAGSYSNIQRGSASAQRIFEILDAKNLIKDKEGAIEINDFKSIIELKNIKFKYEDKWVLDGINIKIPKGKMIALVGQSGSGKTTIANLIPRFYDVNKGEILIDGVNIKDVSKKSLRALMGIVTQDSILFNQTVYENLLLGVEDYSEEQVIKAAKIANAHEFILELPDGYNTNIGDGGNKLSGGQKQRLSIARAVLSNPDILILDEATSALDTESEKLVQESLEYLMKTRTSIVIAHRLSTIQKADAIIVLSKGKVVEVGRHEELIKQDGVYKNLIKLQSF